MPMTPEQADLWSRIAAFEIDQGADFEFSDRLARENGWSKAHTVAVIGEYRRFLFLAFAAGHPVTPSVDVDEAWHLHLIYTRSYWDDLCRDTVGRPLHHGPTRGGKAEAVKFDDWYRRTLESYERLFDRPAPAGIWPSPEIRFGVESRTLHVRPATHWIIPKPHRAIAKAAGSLHFAGMGRTVAMGGAALGLTIALAGCNAAFGGNAGGAGFSNPVTSFGARQFLIFYPLAWVAIFALTTWFQRLLLNERVPDETVREFERESPEMIALMQQRLEQPHRLTEMLMARLIAGGRIRFDEASNRYVKGDIPSKPANPFDAEMLKAVEWGESSPRPPKLTDYAKKLAESLPVRSMQDRIDEKRLFPERAQLIFARLIGFVAIAGFLAIGFARAQVGIGRHRPIGFLILEMVVGGLVGLLWVDGSVLRAWYAPATRIVRGLRVRPAISKPLKAETVAATDDDFWRSFAVVGLAVLPSTGLFDGFAKRIQPPMTDGGGDGGGGGGEGGGGCGGCGG